MKAEKEGRWKRLDNSPELTEEQKDSRAAAWSSAGDNTQASFGFRVKDEKWASDNGVTIRELLDVELFDASIVTYLTYPTTSAERRTALGTDRQVGRYESRAPQPRVELAPVFSPDRERLRLRLALARQL